MNQPQSPPTRRRRFFADRKLSTLGNLPMVRIVPGVVVWCAAAVVGDVSWCPAQQPNRPAAVRVVPVDPFPLGDPSSARPSLRREPAEEKALVQPRESTVAAPVVAAPARPRTPALTPSTSSAIAEQSRSATPSVPPRTTSSLLSRRAEQLGRQLREQFLSGPRGSEGTEHQDGDSPPLAPARSYRSSSDETPAESASEQASRPAEDQNRFPIAEAPAEEAPRQEDPQTLPPGELPNFEDATSPGEVPTAEESLPTPSLSQFIVPARNLPRQAKVGTADDVTPAKANQTAESATRAAVVPIEQTLVTPVVPSSPALETANARSSSKTAQATTSAAPASMNSAVQIRQALQIILQQKFPDHRIRLENEGHNLVVTGVARSRQEAVQIMAFLRDSYLAPVIDRLEVPRAGAAVSSRN